MSGNTSKNQVTRPVTLRHRSKMSGVLIPASRVVGVPSDVHTGGAVSLLSAPGVCE
jgi:hypothetical protein